MNFDPLPFLDASGIGIALAVLIGIFLIVRSVLIGYLTQEEKRRQFEMDRLVRYDDFMRSVVDSSKHEAEARTQAMQEIASANVEAQAKIGSTLSDICRSMEKLQAGIERHEERAQQRQKELLDCMHES